jgi:hypothetical protein
MKIVKDLEKQEEAKELYRKLNRSINEFNEIQTITRNNYVEFFGKIALYSAGSISLAFTGIISLSNNKFFNISSLAILFVVAISFLLLSLILGIFYIYTNTKANYFLSKKTKGEDGIKYQEFLDSIPPVANGVRESFKDNVKKEDQKAQKSRNALSIINWLCPTTFILGLILLFSYFSVQLFCL